MYTSVDLYKDKYRISSARRSKYDYTENGFYFVSICSKDRRTVFGEVVDAKVRMNEVGKVIEGCLLEIPKHFENIILDEFVIMPNHVHVIINIKNFFRREAVTGNIDFNKPDDTNIYDGEHPQMSRISPKPKSKEDFINLDEACRWYAMHDYLIQTRRASSLREKYNGKP